MATIMSLTVVDDPYENTPDTDIIAQQKPDPLCLAPLCRHSKMTIIRLDPPPSSSLLPYGSQGPYVPSYQIYDKNDQQILIASRKEVGGLKNFFFRPCDRPFDMVIVDSKSGNEILHLRRPYELVNGFLRLCSASRYRTVPCGMSINVYSPLDAFIGKVYREVNEGGQYEQFRVINDKRKTLFLIALFKLGYPMSPAYFITREDNEGSVQQETVGFIQRTTASQNKDGEDLPKGDQFYMHFGIPLDVKMKALLIGAFLLMDVIRFQQ